MNEIKTGTVPYRDFEDFMDSKAYRQLSYDGRYNLGAVLDLPECTEITRYIAWSDVTPSAAPEASKVAYASWDHTLGKDEYTRAMLLLDQLSEAVKIESL